MTEYPRHKAFLATISSPELLIAAAPTRRIPFGTGVVWLAHHNPQMVADRIVPAQHMTMGRWCSAPGRGS